MNILRTSHPCSLPVVVILDKEDKEPMAICSKCGTGYSLPAPPLCSMAVKAAGGAKICKGIVSVPIKH